MAALNNLLLPALLLGTILVAVFFLVRARSQRHQSTRSPYNVGRQEAHNSMQVYVLQALAVVVVGFVLLLILAIWRPFAAVPAAPTAEALPTDALPAGAASATPMTLPTQTASPLPSATAVTIPTATVTPTATPEPLATATPEAQTAVVSSGVGVWLRAAPNTESEQLEWLLDGTELTLLDDIESDGELTWQLVQAPSGNVGWVAIQFVSFPDL